MTSLPHHYLTPQEYLAVERAADHKSEYYRGEVFAMSGASRQHNRIAVNLVSELHACMRGTPCEVFGSDLRVRTPDSGLYTYPDATVVCGEQEFEDASQDTLVNPRVVFEILSPSTEAWDRGGKFNQYMSIESLREYILVAQNRVQVEHYLRQSTAGQWLLTVLRGPDAVLRLASVDAELRLADIYERVECETPSL